MKRDEDTPDTLDEPGARRLKAKIEAYWARRDRPVVVMVRPLSMTISERDTPHTLHVIRSNLGLHLPPLVTATEARG